MTIPIQLYVINLEKDVERWQSVLQETSGSFLNTNHVKAINGPELPESNFVSQGVQAAWLSHLKAIHAFLDSDGEFAIIAEDDFHIKNLAKLSRVIKDLESIEWDMVQLGFLKPGFDTRIKIFISHTEGIVFDLLGKLSQFPGLNTKSFSSRMRVVQSIQTPRGFVLDDCQPGAHFYLVRRSFCKSISVLNNPQFLSIDDFYTALSKMRTFRMLRIKRNLVTQKPFSGWVGPRFRRSL